MSTLLRLATAGSVDDGKSTLVGRLLHDSKSVLTDQLDAVERVSRDRGLASADLALLTDGLRAEREQGITIDVAYRYFATAQRSFVLADCPGHVQYTRNTVTGSSTADAARAARRRPQGRARADPPPPRRRRADAGAARRHRRQQDRPRRPQRGRLPHASPPTCAPSPPSSASPTRTPSPSPPSSATTSSTARPNTPWYDGPSLLELLETLPPDTDPAHESFRMPVQVVIRPQGAARSPEHVRVPRVCRSARLRLGAGRRRGRRAALRLAHDRGRHRPRRAVARRRRRARSR